MGEEAIIACVPNFAEACDHAAVAAILSAMHLSGTRLLDLQCDPIANRTVVTLGGAPDTVLESALRGAGKAIECIDLTRQSGKQRIHPRIGAIDVLPFVPVRNCTLSASASLAHEAALELWNRFRLPSYLYAASARRADRLELEQVRQSQFEELREAVLRDPRRQPDVGGPGLHPAAGACAVGGRSMLIEYRVTLSRADLRAARGVARELRERFGPGSGVRVLPLFAEGVAQLDILLTRWWQLGPDLVHRVLKESANQFHTGTAGTRLVGLLPSAAYNPSSEWAAELQGFAPETHLFERRMEAPLPWPNAVG